MPVLTKFCFLNFDQDWNSFIFLIRAFDVKSCYNELDEPVVQVAYWRYCGVLSMNDISGADFLVLIADDDPIFGQLAAACLRKAGFGADQAFDGAQAMHMLLAKNYDLAIVDLVMPRIDGLRLIGLIRATPRLIRLPILIVTSRSDPATRLEGLQVGANDYLTKPVDWPALPEIARRLALSRVSR